MVEKSESAIQAQIMQYFRLLGYKVFRMNAGKTRNNVHLAEPGTPDLLVVGPASLVFWVEVKRPGQKPRDNQLAAHKELEDLGQIVVVTDSLEDMAEKLQEKILNMMRRYT